MVSAPFGVVSSIFMLFYISLGRGGGCSMV
jgi:hypothetical protein